jgi:hypothetical protein
MQGAERRIGRSSVSGIEPGVLVLSTIFARGGELTRMAAKA